MDRASGRPDQVWATGFIHDATQGGRKLKLLTPIDCHARECLAIEVDSSIGGHRVAQVLETIGAERGLPGQIRTDNGPEFTGNALESWAYARGVKLDPHRARKVQPERIHRKLQRNTAQRMPQRTRVHEHCGRLAGHLGKTSGL